MTEEREDASDVGIEVTLEHTALMVEVEQEAKIVMMTEKGIITAASKTLSTTTEVATVSREEEKTQEVDHLHKLEIEDLLEEITTIGTTRPAILQEVELRLVLTSVMAAPTPGTTTDHVSFRRRSPYLYELNPEFIQLSEYL